MGDTDGTDNRDGRRAARGDGRQDRAERLAGALRQNLHRRKAQARARLAQDDGQEPQDDPQEYASQDALPQSGPSGAPAPDEGFDPT